MSKPLSLLDRSRNKLVLIRVRGNRIFRGILKNFDLHLNLTLDECEELKENGEINKLGTLLLRGDNVIMVSPPPVKK